MTKPLATMTVEVIPSLPDDFAHTVQRAVEAATGRALILAGMPMIGHPLNHPAEVNAALEVVLRYADSLPGGINHGDPR